MQNLRLTRAGIATDGYPEIPELSHDVDNSLAARPHSNDISTIKPAPLNSPEPHGSIQGCLC